MQFCLKFSQPSTYQNYPKQNTLKLCLAPTDVKTSVKQSYVSNHFKKHIYFDIRVGFCGLLSIWFLCGQSLWGFMHNHYTVVTLMSCPCWLRNRGSGREFLGLFEGGHWTWCRGLLSQMTIVHLLKSLDKPISLTIHSNNGDQVILEPFRTQIGLILRLFYLVAGYTGKTWFDELHNKSKNGVLKYVSLYTFINFKIMAPILILRLLSITI